MAHPTKERVTISPLAGKPAPEAMLVDLARLEQAYYECQPDASDPNQRVSFGTSGHRGSSLRGSFTEAHIAAITQAICDYRRAQTIDGPLYMGKDTHALSEPAQRTALEVLTANGVETIIQRDSGVTPTPVISWAILTYNRGRNAHFADGIVVTPSHNPPEDGGFKYNPPRGGPADVDVTEWIQNRANALLRAGNAGVKRVPFAVAIKAAITHQDDFVLPYVQDLKNVVDMDAIRGAGLELGVDPLGGAAMPYWEPINSLYKTNITIVNRVIDPTFSFMTVDHDGQIRMDPSSPYAMARLVDLKDQFRVAFANDRRRRSARHRDAHRRADEPQSLSGGGDSLPSHPSSRSGRRTPRSARRWSAAASSIAWWKSSAVGSTKCPSGSSGSSLACSTARAVSAARRARGRAFCGSTARCGRPTRTA